MMKSTVFDHFGFLAPYYESFIRARNPEKLCVLLDCPPTGWVLDAGGGTGRIAQFLIGQTNKVVVADLSIKMLREAKKKSRLLQVCSLAETLPFADHVFQRIVMVDAFHHVEHQEITIKELWRVLCPGGKIVIEEPDISHLRTKLVALLERITMMRSHFLAPHIIASLFPSIATLTIAYEGCNARVVAQKPS
ncbi:MAG: class I SAM-dependent methyltransferase [Anaerolineaceae bacterium]